MSSRPQLKNLFVYENHTGEWGLMVLVRNHSLSYGDEQNRQTTPAVGFAVERDF